MATSYGSQIYSGHRPLVDEACVARLRAADAIIIGKTVTTEVANWHVGATRNPHDLSRSPGGSSSGSCAGLAAPSAKGEAPLAETGTGNPDMSRAWTLLDLPSLTIPCGTGPSGLPLGLQLAARPGHDAILRKAAQWVEKALAVGAS